MSNTVMIKDLKRGDRVELEDGAMATITKVVRCHLIEVPEDVAYQVTFQDADEIGNMIVGGKERVSVR